MNLLSQVTRPINHLSFFCFGFAILRMVCTFAGSGFTPLSDRIYPNREILLLRTGTFLCSTLSFVPGNLQNCGQSHIVFLFCNAPDENIIHLHLDTFNKCCIVLWNTSGAEQILKSKRLKLYLLRVQSYKFSEVKRN